MSILLEATLRSLVMGALVLITLRLLRIEQIRARRTAWLLALAGALAMPVLVAAQIGPRLLPVIAAPQQQAYLTLDEPYIAAAASSIYRQAGAQRAVLVERERQSAQSVPGSESVDGAAGADRGAGAQSSIVLTLAVIGYCAVAAVLSLRLCAGVGFALRLRNQAERVIFPFDPELDVRISRQITSPVTIGSSVLLPSGHVAWDEATLRIVLSHERAHVRQADFCVHALAGLHCALFWFNPFSWWLQRQLSELGEALSDCAAVAQADSRASYAETLLAFATRARWPLAAVAMASSSNLSPRIERLLSDHGFERSFAPAQRLPFIAAGVVALAMFASTSMVRATDTNPSSPPALPDSPPVPNTPISPAVPIAPPAPAAVSPPAPAAPVAPPAKASVRIKKSGNTVFVTDEDDGDTVIENGRAASEEEGVLAINSEHSHIMFDSGNRLPSQRGDYIYFQHNGKTYLIQDPQIIAKAQAMLEPMKQLREQQRMLGDQQALLGAQQRVLGSKQRSIKIVETPEFKQQMAELQKTIKELDLPRLTAQIDQHALAELQSHLGEIQSRVGELQSEFGAQQGQIGEEQGKLGEQQGKLGEQQGRLGEQQRKIVEEVRRQLKPIVEQAIREGKGKALENW
jgi:beta-lactamase regulating signal transducer with metallopeptidase domain